MTKYCAIKTQERLQLNKIFRDLRGHSLLSIGGTFTDEDFVACQIPLQISLQQACDEQNALHKSTVLARMTELPFLEDSLDSIILGHALEAQKQYISATIQECWRVLKPMGTLYIFSFNPVSLLAFAQYFNKPIDLPDKPWPSLRKITHMLHESHFVIQDCKTLFYRSQSLPPWLYSALSFWEYVGPLCFPFRGGICYVQAQKQNSTFTPLRLTWREKLQLATTPLEPTARRE